MHSLTISAALLSRSGSLGTGVGHIKPPILAMTHVTGRVHSVHSLSFFSHGTTLDCWSLLVIVVTSCAFLCSVSTLVIHPFPLFSFLFWSLEESLERMHFPSCDNYWWKTVFPFEWKSVCLFTLVVCLVSPCLVETNAWMRSTIANRQVLSHSLSLVHSLPLVEFVLPIVS